jgi:ubiquinone/menaquinone biosynthesis C-methylase UbiE
MRPNSRVLLIPIGGDWVEVARAASEGVLVGVSRDLDLLDAARERAESEGLMNCMFVVGDENEIPFRDRYFTDAVLGVERTAEIQRVMA